MICLSYLAPSQLSVHPIIVNIISNVICQISLLKNYDFVNSKYIMFIFNVTYFSFKRFNPSSYCIDEFFSCKITIRIRLYQRKKPIVVFHFPSLQSLKNSIIAIFDFVNSKYIMFILNFTYFIVIRFNPSSNYINEIFGCKKCNENQIVLKKF